MTRLPAYLGFSVWIVFLCLSFPGCDAGRQPDEREQAEPVEVVMPSADIKEEVPVAVVYTERWIREQEWRDAQRSGERLLRRPVRLAVWEDGTVIWSSYIAEAAEPSYRRAEVADKQVREALDRLDNEGVFGLGSKQGLIQFHADSDVILIDAGERRRLRLVGSPPPDAAFRKQWQAARTAFESLIPEEGEPIDVSFSF